MKFDKSDFITFEDGYKYYCPKDGAGGYSANDLRQIADKLDKMNAKWDRDLCRYMATHAIEDFDDDPNWGGT